MASSRRPSSKLKPLESNENDPRNPSYPIPSSIPRSPLNSIQDPSLVSNNASQTGVLTPKSVQIAAARSGARVSGGIGGGRERGLSSRVSKGAQDGGCLDAVEVPSFELNEDPAFWEDHNVQVLIRMRPISSAEIALQGNKRCLIQESSQTLTWAGHPETRFTFDHVACETISQEKLFRVVGLPMVDNCMSGYNSCMFAYGQTGSGKTYTMMGEIQEMDTHLSDHRGMTPRIFEYLFMRIREEEERQSEEKLKYSCTCSFLEIYNEQIMDLLEPSSTNLQLREDIKKGVYVENLKEYEVSSVKDVIELLLQGAANRKMASTHMNSESSRSHCVFTCVIESRREKDSMTHIRFGRLNLVDLAGSERQKSSGAEGERLKEAANINRSLSTLGLVIMTLVDITNGKNRHVPYRDSRLTFLLQDSLGGNSKTTIIANVSPSICSASETLSTLKFAQRAKLIQNNAKVNEDASGDVVALQRQIQTLKDQLTILIRHQNISRSPSHPSQNHEQTTSSDLCRYSQASQGENPGALNDPCLLNKEIKQLETSLIGALRREEEAEASVRRLEDEIKHMSRLVHQREDDTQRARTLLRFREEKLRRLELLADDLVTSDGYLMEENVALSQEIQILREGIDRNPELTQFALENMRLLEQLRIYQNFYQQGERDALLAEVSYLRNQLVKVLEGRSSMVSCGATKVELTSPKGYSRDQIASAEHAESSQGISIDQEKGDTILLFREIQKELSDAKLVIKEMETQQARLLVELGNLKQENERYLELSRRRHMDAHFTEQLENYDQISEGSSNAGEFNYLDAEEMTECGDTTQITLYATLQRLLEELVQAKVLNRQLLDNPLFGQDQVEADIAHVILSLQEELASLKKEFDSKNAGQLSLTDHSLFARTRNGELDSRLSLLIQENVKLSNLVSARDSEINAVSYEWEKAIIDLTTFLTDGCRSLDYASEYIESVVESFPFKSTCINEHVERAIKVFIEKETLILDLQRGLEDAQKKGLEVKSKLNSLRGATLAITEVQQLEHDENTKELAYLWKLLNEKLCILQELESILKCNEDHIIEAVKVANSSTGLIKKLHDMDSTDSLSVGEIKLMIQELLDENFQQVTNYENGVSVGSFVRGGTASELHASTESNMLSNTKVSHLNDQLTTKVMDPMQENSVERMEEISAGCSQTREILDHEFHHAMQDVEDRTKHANDLLIRFEAVQDTMEEAELVLKALLKANEGAKHEKDLWKQVSGELLTDKTTLLEEVQRLEASNYSKCKEYENLQVQVYAGLRELIGLTSSLVESFHQIQRIIQEELNIICSGIFSFRQELLKIIGNSRLCLEEMTSEVMEKNFEMFVLYQCHRGALFKQIMHLSRYSNSFQLKEDRSYSVLINEDILERNIIADRLKDQLESSNLSLKEELARKDKLIEGLLFDLRLLQESSSNVKGMKDELEEIREEYNQVCHELAIRSGHIDKLLAEKTKLEASVIRIEAELFSSKSELEQAQEDIIIFSDENNKLKHLLEDEILNNSQTEELLEDKMKIIEGLQSQIFSFNSSVEGHISTEEIMNELRMVVDERDNLQTEIIYLNDRLEMASALADENEAIAVEARQIAEASKIYAEDKEEEVKVLEHSVEELEDTINILEKKVGDMKEEVERHHSVRNGLEVEVRALTHRLLTVENAAGNLIAEYLNIEGEKCHIPRQLDDRIIELCEARRRIEDLEMEKSYTAEEIKQYQEHISELVLHSEAQVSLYQEKYKALEAMVTEVKHDPATSNPSCAAVDKTERTAARMRGSGSPFRCISSLVQQMSLEKDQELSAARCRIEDLEALAADRQKEVCMLTARLAATESMTHDVIRDLMGVKLDMTNYANLIDQEQLLNLLQKAQQQSEETIAKEKEILNFKKYIDRLLKERESWIEEVNQRKADILASELTVEELQQREQLLAAQNETLKIDKAHLCRRIAELDERIKFLIRSQQNNSGQVEQHETCSARVGNEELRRRLAQSDKLLSHMRTSMKNKST